MHFHETLIIFCVLFFFLSLFCSFLFLFLIPRWKHAWPTARKWKLLLIRQNQIICGARVSWNRNLELCQTSVESGRFGAVIWRAVPCANEGKRVSFAQNTRRGLNERYFQPFPGFPHFFSPFAGTSQEQPSQAPAYTARTCSCREEKWGKSLVPPAAAIWKIMYSYEDVGVACHWAVFCHQKRYRNLWLERYNLPAKSCFYQSNEPEEAGN